MPELVFTRAITRQVANSFADALTTQSEIEPINVKLAQQQHEMYTQVLRELLPTVISLPPIESCPDCNFVEDPAVIIDNTALITIVGAVSRRGESQSIADELQRHDVRLVHMSLPGTLDGGDVLYTGGKEIFVGISKRTNLQGIDQLRNAFPHKNVIVLEVEQGLHLKSVISFMDVSTLVMPLAHQQGSVHRAVQALGAYEIVFVPDAIAANVLRVGQALLVQDRFPASYEVLSKAAAARGLVVKTLNMSELIKADGALTCGSLLF